MYYPYLYVYANIHNNNNHSLDDMNTNIQYVFTRRWNSLRPLLLLSLTLIIPTLLFVEKEDSGR